MVGDRRSAPPTVRPDPEPRRDREGIRGARTRAVRGGSPGSLGRDRGHRSRRAGLGRERDHVRTPQAAGRGGELPGSEGLGELPGIAGGAHRDRVEDRLCAPVLQRAGALAEHADPVLPVERDRHALPLRASRVLRHRGLGPRPGARRPREHNHGAVVHEQIAAGIPKPRVYVVPEQAPNAFATGRDPQHSSIAVTQGLLDIMNRVELEGVIGHEMSHVLDRDILVGTVVATVVGAAVLMSEFFMRSWFWSGGRMGGRRDGGDGGSIVTLVLFAVGIVLLIIAPLAGQLIKLSVSRNREYLADAQGVLLTRYPPGLIGALEKIRDAPHAMRSANNATAHLWLEQPSRVPGQETSTMEKLFSTHPPIEERIQRLKEM